jgi:hypothetical protein
MRISANSRLTVRLKLDIYGAPLVPDATSVMTRIAVFFFLAALAVAGANAQVHKCIDAKGKIIYSQDPCPANTKSGTVTRRVDRPLTPAAAAAGSATKRRKETRRKPDPNAAELEQDTASASRIRPRNPRTRWPKRSARELSRRPERLANYEIGGRMTRVNPQGERYYLEDAQIEQEKARARADVAQACN